MDPSPSPWILVFVPVSCCLNQCCEECLINKYVFETLCKPVCGSHHRVSTARGGEPLWTWDGSCVLSFQRRGLSHFCSGVCWDLCLLTVSLGLVTTRPGHCQSDGDNALCTVYICMSPLGGLAFLTCIGGRFCLLLELHVIALCRF